VAGPEPATPKGKAQLGSAIAFKAVRLTTAARALEASTSMLTQALQLAPYIAIASGILLGTTIAVICYRQRVRNADSGARRASMSSILERWRPLLHGRWSLPPAVIIHDPGAAKPHDLDDPFFDNRVQELVGTTIANAARKT
jgi:hypothetical protein